jgi:hypothetical protein
MRLLWRDHRSPSCRTSGVVDRVVDERASAVRVCAPAQGSSVGAVEQVEAVPGEECEDRVDVPVSVQSVVVEPQQGQ